jgi:hypothetical protein
MPSSGMISGTVSVLKLVAGGNPGGAGPSELAGPATVGVVAVGEPDAAVSATVRLAHPATPISTDAPQANSRTWHPSLPITYLRCTSF